MNKFPHKCFVDESILLPQAMTVEYCIFCPTCYRKFDCDGEEIK